jgi:hypothetical protein
MTYITKPPICKAGIVFVRSSQGRPGPFRDGSIGISSPSFFPNCVASREKSTKYTRRTHTVLRRLAPLIGGDLQAPGSPGFVLEGIRLTTTSVLVEVVGREVECKWCGSPDALHAEL